MGKACYWLIPFVLAALWGCSQSAATGPAQEVSCNGNFGYFFVSNDAWLWTTSSLYSIADPSNPLRHSQPGYQLGGDTAFFVDTNVYIVNNGSISISTIGSQIYPQYESLTAYPRQLAYAPGYIYFLRHKGRSLGNQFCWQPTDTVDELDVDRFTDTSYSATLFARVPLTDPADIAIMDSTLFVLDGTAGLKVFSVSDPTNPVLSTTMASVQGYHLQLTDQSTLLVVTAGGIQQYDVSKPASPVLVSTIQ